MFLCFQVVVMCLIILVFPTSLCLEVKPWAGLLGAAECTAKQSCLRLTWLRKQAQEGGVISPRGLLLFVGRIRRTGDFIDAALK